MVCRTCGAENVEGAAYCRGCGSLLAEVSECGGQVYGQGGYGEAPEGDGGVGVYDAGSVVYGERKRTSGLAIASLVLGILGFCCCGPVLGLVGLILGILGLVETGRAGAVVGGRGVAMAGVVVSIFSMVLGVAAMVFVMVSEGEFSTEVFGHRIERIQCENQLDRLGRALGSYQRGHGGRNPASLAELVASEGIPSGMLTCPGTGSGMGSGSYVYRGGDLDVGAAGNMVLIHDAWGNHGESGYNVLLANGAVHWVAEEELEEMVAWDNAERSALGLAEKDLWDVGEPEEGWLEEEGEGFDLEAELEETEPGVLL